MLGLTNEQLAGVFEVHVDTIDQWMRTHEAFSDAIKAGRTDADGQVAHSLWERAIGYNHEAVKIFADPKTGAEHIVEYTEHYPPDTVACIFWLKNRRPGLWRDKPPTPPWLPAAIEGGDLTTEAGILEVLRALTAHVLEGKVPVEHAKGVAVLLGAILQAERGAMEGKVAQALAQLQGIIEGKAPAGQLASPPGHDGGESGPAG
jgi:hypothetical protein